jgi:long-chain fatty acid transport protein
MLRHADRVLTPSRYLADAAIANGVSPARVTVAANGVARIGARADRLAASAARRPGPIRFGWAKFDRIRLTLPAGAFVPEEYRNTWMVAGGVDWQTSDDFTLRGGVYWDQTPTQDGRRDPNVPDGNRTAVTSGGSYRLNDRFTIDFAAEYISFARSSIDRGTVAPGGTVVITNGTSKAHAIILGAGGRFAL